MSKLSLFNDIFREPWMIEPLSAAAQKQVLHGLLMGLEFTQEEEAVQASIGHKHYKTIPAGKQIDVVNLEGTMLRDDGPCGMKGTRTIASELLKADSDPNIIGHILRIDSGGGAANSVPDLADAIRSCTKPVVAFVDGYMCSAAMYAGSYCRHIIANREEDRIGCIGTMVQLADWPKQARESDGYMHIRVYADGAEEKNDEYEAALEGDFKLIKERMLNPTNERFKADIKANRPSVREDQLKGRTYSARETVGTLIDSIGSFDTAVEKVIQLSNITIQKMEGFKKLQSIESCSDLQEVDGTVTLNRDQLEAIEEALPDADAKTVSQEELDQANATIQTLRDENATLRSQNEASTTKVSELEDTITKLQNKPAAPSEPKHNGNPDGSEQADNNDPETYCRNLKKEIYG